MISSEKSILQILGYGLNKKIILAFDRFLPKIRI